MKTNPLNRQHARITDKLKFFLLSSIFLGFSLSFSQSIEDSFKSADLSSFGQSGPIVLQAVPYWAEDTASIRLIILYQLQEKFFSFIKQDNVQSREYAAKGELGIEILDSRENSISRDFRPLRIEHNSLPSSEVESSNVLNGAFAFTLKKGSYIIIAELKDYISGRSFSNRDRKMTVRAFSPSSASISPLVFVEPVNLDTSSSGRNIFRCFNNGGNIIIGRQGGCLFQVISSDTITEINFSWQIKNRSGTDEKESPEFKGNRSILHKGIPSITEEANGINFEIANSLKGSRVAYIPLPIKRLEPGPYRITITTDQGKVKEKTESNFNVIWPNEPRSLTVFNVAVEALKHIATKEEIELISSSNDAQSRKEFFKFWQKRNPDTTNAYNPAMAEYYRRVDESIKRYSTGDEPDGYRTDRGRIYILFGAPTFSNRILNPNTAPTEIWTYEKLRQRFVFVDQHKNGNYVCSKKEEY